MSTKENLTKQLSDVIAGFFSRKPDPPDSHAAHNNAAAAIPEVAISGKESDLEERLKRQLAKEDVVSAGGLQIIGLDTVRDRLGDRWRHVRDHVHATASKIIERRLGPTDVFTQYGDLGYVMVFGGLSKQQAQIKCALIAEEIVKRVLGNDTIGEAVNVKTVVAAVDGAVTAESVNVLDAIGQLLEKEARNDTGEGQAPIGDAARSFEDGPTRSTGSPDFAYWPVWDVQRNAHLSFLCKPVHEKAMVVSRVGYELLGSSPTPFAIAELDMFVQARLVAELRRLYSKGRRIPLVGQVHFETLAGSKKRAAYIDRCSLIPRDLVPYIVFELVGLPDDVPQTRACDLLLSIKNFARAVHAEVSLGRRVFANLRGTGIHALGADIRKYDRAEADLFSDLLPPAA